MAAGLKLGGAGHEFTGSYSFGTKGCYAKSSGFLEGRAFYNTEGSSADKSANPGPNEYRVPGHDCKVAGKAVPQKPVCADVTDFVDDFGYDCVGWKGWDCTNSPLLTSWGYQVYQQEEIIQNCRKSCG